MTEKNVIRLVYALLILFNLKFIFYIVQVPYTFFFVNYREKSSFASAVKLLKENAGFLKEEYDVGFISDVKRSRVLDEVSSVKNFYVAQYAIVPAILKNDIEEKYTIGIFEKSTNVPVFLKPYKKINANMYIFKREGR